MKEKTYPEYTTHYPLLIKGCLKRPLTLYPDDIAMVYRNDGGQYSRFTWRQWHERTCQLAHAMKSLGVKPGGAFQPGDRIATMALNHHRHMENIYATVCTGAISHPINIRLSLDHMAYTITHAEDKLVFFDDLMLPLVEALYDRIKPAVQGFVYMSDKPGLPKTKIEPLYEYEELIKGQPTTYDWPDFSEDTYAVLYYTTGTTGLPKGALYTHRQVFVNTLGMLTSLYLAPRLPDDPPQQNQLVPLLIVPLFHIHAWGAPFYHVFAAAKMVFSGRFTPETFCELVQTEKVNTVALVPTMLAMLIEYPDIEKYDLSSLTRLSVGGGALPLGLKRKAEKLFPTMRATSGYGMSETMAGVLSAGIKRNMVDWPEEKIDEVLVKTGVSRPMIDCRVIDENGKDVPHDNQTIGEIVLRGHWIMEKYFKDPERTAAAWKDGWFHTGDAAKVDTDGYVIITDRITDVIRSGSEMVPTVLLENLTCNADFVLEATYVGVPDEKWGEIPMALVKLASGTKATEEDILTHLQREGVDKGKITRWMLPVYVAICDDVPKTSVGKYDKIAIRKKMDEYTSKAKMVRKP
ncbi:MAG: long-chain-fatty-acid--CoA ligase [Chloroflexota bacterium]|nr:MAG: long-chain-fatty-acid--CoA ligase [Chloroflexota bacterium]